MSGDDSLSYLASALLSYDFVLGIFASSAVTSSGEAPRRIFINIPCGSCVKMVIT